MNKKLLGGKLMIAASLKSIDLFGIKNKKEALLLPFYQIGTLW
ncbi:hypothetical protein ACRN9C_01500 [Shewanella frigidimarina]